MKKFVYIMSVSQIAMAGAIISNAAHRYKLHGDGMYASALVLVGAYLMLSAASRLGLKKDE